MAQRIGKQRAIGRKDFFAAYVVSVKMALILTKCPHFFASEGPAVPCFWKAGMNAGRTPDPPHCIRVGNSYGRLFSMYFILKGRKLRFGASIFQNLVGGPQTPPSLHWLKQDSWKKCIGTSFSEVLRLCKLGSQTFFKKFLRLRNSHRYASGPCCKLTVRQKDNW